MQAQQRADELFEASQVKAWDEFDVNGSGRLTPAKFSAGIARAEQRQSLGGATALAAEIASVLKEQGRRLHAHAEGARHQADSLANTTMQRTTLCSRFTKL